MLSYSNVAKWPPIVMCARRPCARSRCSELEELARAELERNGNANDERVEPDHLRHDGVRLVGQVERDQHRLEAIRATALAR